MTAVRPMKPCQYLDWLNVSDARRKYQKFPLYVQPKVDGIRCLITEEGAQSSSGKLLPNRHLQRFARTFYRELYGLDGELICRTSFQDTASIVMAQDKNIRELKYLVFDSWNVYGNFQERFTQVQKQAIDLINTNTEADVRVVKTDLVEDHFQLTTSCRFEGPRQPWYDGWILRSAQGYYKNGRSTPSEGLLVKWKPITLNKAVIVDYAPLMRNINAPTTNELGLIDRSSCQENKIEDDLLGSLKCQLLGTNINFKIGTGFSTGQRIALWKDRTTLIGRTVLFKSLPVGVKHAPRHPVFIKLED